METPELGVPEEAEYSLRDAPNLQVRALVAADQAFVYGTWLQGHFEKSLWAKGMEWELYKNHHRAHIEAALQRGHTLVACTPEDANQILGYVCFEWSNELWPPVLHYAFTKGPFRRFGVFTRLMEEAGFTPTTPFAFSQLNNSDLAHHLRKKYTLARYNPYLLTL